MMKEITGHQQKRTQREKQRKWVRMVPKLKRRAQSTSCAGLNEPWPQSTQTQLVKARQPPIFRTSTDPEIARSCGGEGWNSSSQRSLWSSPELPPSSQRNWSLRRSGSGPQKQRETETESNKCKHRSDQNTFKNHALCKTSHECLFLLGPHCWDDYAALANPNMNTSHSLSAVGAFLLPQTLIYRSLNSLSSCSAQLLLKLHKNHNSTLMNNVLQVNDLQSERRLCQTTSSEHIFHETLEMYQLMFYPTCSDLNKTSITVLLLHPWHTSLKNFKKKKTTSGSHF